MKSSLKRNEETLTTINGDLTDVFDESMLVMLNIGGTLFTLLLESIRKASYQDGFLSKFIQLTHKDRLKVGALMVAPLLISVECKMIGVIFNSIKSPLLGEKKKF